MGWLSWLRGPQVEAVDVTEARRLQSEGAVLIDVREPNEWAEGHVQGAKLMPLGTLDRELPRLPTNRQLLFICRTGSRSARATNRAAKHGLRAVNVRGGIGAWARAGLPLKNGRR